jgi:hypothetical protein
MNLRRALSRALMFLVTPVLFLMLGISLTCIAINYGLVSLVRMIEK